MIVVIESLGIFESTINTAIDWVEFLGLPMLFLIFISKGMLVGKIFPTSVFLPGYVILTRASLEMAAVIAIVTAIGYIIGQYVVFLGTRQYGRSFITRLPYADIDPDSERFVRFDLWFNRYGGASIFTTNFLPWVRGLITIPAATSSYPTSHYLFHTTTSTILYHIVYVALALVGLEVVGSI